MIQVLVHLFYLVFGILTTMQISIMMVNHDHSKKPLWKIILLLLIVLLFFYSVGVGFITLLKSIGVNHAINSIIENIPKFS